MFKILSFASLLAILSVSGLRGQEQDSTDKAIQAATVIIDNTILKIDTVTLRIMYATTGQEAALLVGEFLSVALSIKDEVSNLEKRFPAHSLDQVRLKKALKVVMDKTKAAGQRFGAALMSLPEEIRNSTEVAEALKKLQGAM